MMRCPYYKNGVCKLTVERVDILGEPSMCLSNADACPQNLRYVCAVKTAAIEELGAKNESLTQQLQDAREENERLQSTALKIADKGGQEIANLLNENEQLRITGRNYADKDGYVIAILKAENERLRKVLLPFVKGCRPYMVGYASYVTKKQLELANQVLVEPKTKCEICEYFEGSNRECATCFPNSGRKKWLPKQALEVKE